MARRDFDREFVLLGVALLAAACGGTTQTAASADPVELALVRVEPADGTSAVPRNRAVRLIFNTAVLPGSVHDQSLKIRSGGTFQTRPEGSFVISGNVVEFDPTVSSAGGANSLGFPAGEQIVVEIPLKLPNDNQAAENFLQNIEGNPITVASGANLITFTTGCTWDDKRPGPPGLIGLEFTPAANAVGQVPSNAAVTVIFNEPVDPETVLLGVNIFLTNNTSTAGPTVFQQDIPSSVFFDGSLTRYTFKPVFGFGQGPFNILVNFIDPDRPDTFDPQKLPRDLGGNQVQNFTFFQTFDTQFDPVVRNVGTLVENFTMQTQLDPALTDAVWGNDTSVPFALIGAPITTRVQNIDVRRVLMFGGLTDLPDVNAHPTLPAPANEGRFCTLPNPLVGADISPVAPDPPTSAGRRTLNLYRAAELGPAGTVIRAAWAPQIDTTTASSYPRVILRMGHKRSATNLTVQSFQSEFDVDLPVVLADTRYSVGQSSDVNNNGFTNDGFLDWPQFDNFFAYDGVNDLLLDIQAQEGTASQRFRIFVAVTTGALVCNCAAIRNQTGGCLFNNSIGVRSKQGIFGSELVQPIAGAVPPNPGNFVYLMQFELAKLTSTGTSRYYDTGASDPDYLAALLAPLVQPCGASLSMRWSGSMDGVVEDVPFTPNIDSVDGMRFIRFEATLRSNFFTLSRARLNLLTIPFIRN